MTEKKRLKYEDIADPRALNRWELPINDEIIRIPCPEGVKRDFKVFRDKYGFKNYWSALLYLLKNQKEPHAPGDRVISISKEERV